ncbi:hypothetical protein [Christiangramia sp. SM2212]|uniref:Uncharacterized protein n=1 Tax=Christiangramia sediminicola TaxID=3073267 RepID=A0ABU1ENG3_9FLAO|nr:hypothetical protein [Christiangramia sp. SM2212]MDR5589902.1 hypothetical protein [Christiangramia sp. SM2212]
MRRVLSIMLILLFCSFSFAQEQTYLTFEFMKVDNDQEQFYVETEDFWEKIHEQRVASGDIVGWDLWQLLPGGEDQGYQYLTVTVFDDPMKMMNAGAGIMESARMAYPDLSDEELQNRVNLAGGSRDLAVRLFLMVMDRTNGDYEMKPGMVATMDLMKANDGNYSAYETAEGDTFKPLHQKMVDGDAKGSWELLKVLLPQGSDVYASHLTVNMYDNWEQYLDSMNFDAGITPAMEKKMDDGLETRDMKWSYMATLTKMVRK